MSITVRANPPKLEWKHFVGVPTVSDPVNRKPLKAYTTFEYRVPACKPCEREGGLGFDDSMIIDLVPKACVKMGTARTLTLLTHERFRYNVGVVTGRALARKLAAVRVDKFEDLRVALVQACQLHLRQRATAIQQRYDQDTRHGTYAINQKVWNDLMADCLQDDAAEFLGGLEL